MEGCRTINMSVKDDLKKILEELLRTAASDIFINKSLDIIEESECDRESLIAASDRISKRIGLFIDDKMAKPVFERLKAEIEKQIAGRQTQRRHERLNLSAEVRVACNGTSFELSMKTISLEGMYIRTDNPFPVGTTVEIVLPVETGRQIHLRGVVIYIKNLLSNTSTYPPGMAVNFRDMKDTDFGTLRDYIKQNSPEPRNHLTS
jgi:hypothetical protein